MIENLSYFEMILRTGFANGQLLTANCRENHKTGLTQRL